MYVPGPPLAVRVVLLPLQIVVTPAIAAVGMTIGTPRIASCILVLGAPPNTPSTAQSPNPVGVTGGLGGVISILNGQVPNVPVMGIVIIFSSVLFTDA